MPYRKKPHQSKASKDMVRLNKYIADCTGISRRKADELIASGEIKINRRVPVVGQQVNPEKDTVMYNGEALRPQRKKYLVFHKPKGVLTTRNDPEGRQTIYNLLPAAFHSLDPVGRLDRDSSGLLLLTNDGDFLNQAAHPKYHHVKVYRVEVDRIIVPADLERLEAGVMLEPENQLAKAKIQEIRDKKTLVLGLQTGMNRQIRRSFLLIGYNVIGLKRLSFAGITLGNLRPGEFRPLKPWEIRIIQRGKPMTLKRQLQKSKADREEDHLEKAVTPQKRLNTPDRKRSPLPPTPRPVRKKRETEGAFDNLAKPKKQFNAPSRKGSPLPSKPGVASKKGKTEGPFEHSANPKKRFNAPGRKGLTAFSKNSTGPQKQGENDTVSGRTETPQSRNRPERKGSFPPSKGRSSPRRGASEMGVQSRPKPKPRRPN